MTEPNTDHQDRYEQFLKVPQDSAPGSFSIFNRKDISAAASLANEYLQHADQHPDEHEKAVHHVLNKAQEHSDSETHDPEVIRHAVKLFGVHHPGARKVLAFPRLIQRAPHLVVPSADTSDPVALFREDPNMNEHHEHWHIVYPGEVVGNAKDRQGEMFAYMHKQMLARYDAEFICNGLPPVEAFDLYNPILPGYSPNVHLLNRDDGGNPFAGRDDGQKIQDEDINIINQWYQNFQKAIENGSIDGQPITASSLGSIIESEGDQSSEIYGTADDKVEGLHNKGHDVISRITNTEGSSGPIGDPRTACRDPAFWQWHRFVDNLYNYWQDSQPVYDWTGDDAPPPIKINEIKLAFNDTIENNNNIDEIATTELQTTYLARNFTWVEDDQSSNYAISYLFPREFTYYFTVENTSDQPISVTFRIFMAPASQVDSRIHWIELDKFRQDIPTSNDPTIVTRNCDVSSVIRKPAQKYYQHLDDTAVPVGQKSKDSWCDCGWPFHLLLPRGNEEGAEFKLFVFASDWNIDQVPDEKPNCGSSSYCGTFDKYPDSRPMGYPFDRPFKNGQFSDTFGDTPNNQSLDITVKLYKDAEWAEPYAEKSQQ